MIIALMMAVNYRLPLIVMGLNIEVYRCPFKSFVSVQVNAGRVTFTQLHWYSPLLQRQIQFKELTKVEAIGEGGFGVVHRAKHHNWGTVVYKELKSSIITDDSKYVNHSS